MRLVYVPMPAAVVAALTDLAAREWRSPRDQAAMLVIDGLRRAGVLADADAGRTTGGGGCSADDHGGPAIAAEAAR